MRRFALVLLISLSPCLLVSPSFGADIPAAHKPDAKAVQRYGDGYRYPQAGWVVLHIEGDPYPRGYQHGRLLAAEIAKYAAALARDRYPKDPAEGWKTVRTLTDALFLRKFDREFLEEMKGIADGAADAGAKFEDRKIDVIDVAALNVWQELDTLDPALAAAPTGLERAKFKKPDADAPVRTAPVPAKKDHCSAFAATGPATADGKIVFGHITWFGLHFGPYVNVWIDCKPTKGRRFVMQAFPGGVWSSQDYYQNDAGILLCETTIDQTPFDATGEPLTTRARKAIQYSESIDEVVKYLSAKNNGLYTNEWLIGDTKTDEIAMFELGTKKSKLWRSSKDEWFGGTKGLYWGCNNAKDLELRLEATRADRDRPDDVEWHPDGRDKAWLRWFEKYNGKIDEAAAKAAFGSPPLAGPHSLDAKFTTTTLAKELAAHALYGPPTGRVWQPTVKDRIEHPDIRPLVSHPWTVLTINPPPEKKPDDKKPADLPEKVPDPLAFEERVKPAADPETKPAWTGTLLPKSDGDYWLTSAFAEYERIVALEKAGADKDRIELALFEYRAKWSAARAAEPPWRKALRGDGPEIKPPTELTRTLDRDRWMRQQSGGGVLTLHGLRQTTGAEAFDAAVDAFGRANDRKRVTADAFLAALGKTKGEVGRADAEPAFSTRSFLDEPGDCLIVYGTADDEAANRAAARALQELIRKRCAGVSVPVVADKDATDAELGAKHLLLVGGPSANRVSARCAKGLPVTFAGHTFAVKGEEYAHAETCVVAARANPLNPRFSAVVLAGLSAAATFDAPEFLMSEATPAAEVIVGAANERARPLVVTR
jgi:Phospholipase B